MARRRALVRRMVVRALVEKTRVVNQVVRSKSLLSIKLVKANRTMVKEAGVPMIGISPNKGKVNGARAGITRGGIDYLGCLLGIDLWEWSLPCGRLTVRWP